MPKSWETERLFISCRSRKENKPSRSNKTDHETNANNGISEKCHKEVDEAFFLWPSKNFQKTWMLVSNSENT